SFGLPCNKIFREVAAFGSVWRRTGFMSSLQTIAESPDMESGIDSASREIADPDSNSTGGTSREPFGVSRKKVSLFAVSVGILAASIIVLVTYPLGRMI